MALIAIDLLQGHLGIHHYGFLLYLFDKLSYLHQL